MNTLSLTFARQNSEMEIITLLAIALGLSFDTFAVSLSYGVVQARISFRQAVRVALVMALFQGGFPVAGYFLGSAFREVVEPVDHWVAFGLLFLLGLKMILDGFKDSDKKVRRDITRTSILIALAVGTSIDAFVIGLGLGFLHANIWISAFAIGIITFLASMLAIRIGKGVGSRLGRRVEIVGGLILVLIGLKILLEHLL